MNQPPTQNPLPQPEGSNPPPENQKRQGQVVVKFPRRSLWMAFTLMGMTIFIFILQYISQTIFQGLDFLALFGMKINSYIQSGQVWRLFTPIFLHASLVHIGINMYSLYALGPAIERYYGPWRFLGLYLLSGVAGNVVSFAMTNANSLGASTAIFGLATAEAVFIYRNRFLFGAQARSMLVNILVIIGVNLALGASMSNSIDNWGHLGGLLGGLAFGWFAGPVLEVRGMMSEYHLVDQQTSSTAWRVGIIEAVIIIGVTAAIIVLR
jgi:rhomboid protease GluP